MSSSDCECSICCDDITVETGSVKLGGCAHSYHFRCITSWFASQEVSTCPLCRKEMTDLADFAPPAEDESDDESYDEDDEDEEGEIDEEFIRISRASLDALVATHGGPHGCSEDEMPTFDNDGYTIICRFELDILLQITGGRFLNDDQWASMMEEFPMPAPVASSAPAAEAEEADAAEEEAAEAEPAPAALPPLSITWHLQEGGRWVRRILNPEEDTGVSATATGWKEPVLISAEVAEKRASEAAESLQEAWRSFKARKEAKDEGNGARILMGMRLV